MKVFIFVLFWQWTTFDSDPSNKTMTSNKHGAIATWSNDEQSSLDGSHDSILNVVIVFTKNTIRVKLTNSNKY